MLGRQTQKGSIAVEMDSGMEAQPGCLGKASGGSGSEPGEGQWREHSMLKNTSEQSL